MITVDFYGNMLEIIEDCLEELQPFIDDVLPDRKKDTKNQKKNKKNIKRHFV